MRKHNRSMNKASEKNKGLESVKVEINEQDQLVPVVIFAFHDRIPDCSYCEPSVDVDDYIWDEGIGCNEQPVSNAVRILIRPDVSKQETINILIKMMWIIDQDKHDWQLEAENYRNRWKDQIAIKNYLNTLKSKTSRQ